MTKCPFACNSYGNIKECDESCVFYEEHYYKGCLLAALAKKAVMDTTSEEGSIENKTKKLERQVQMASIGFPIYPFEVSPKGMEINSIEKDWSGLQGGL